jgi:hypothetical protein
VIRRVETPGGESWNVLPRSHNKLKAAVRKLKIVIHNGRTLHPRRLECLLQFNIYKFERVRGLVESLRYNPAGRGFDSLWSNCGFPLTNPPSPTTALKSAQASNRNEYQVFLGE